MLESQNNLIEAHSSLVIVDGQLSIEHSRVHENIHIKNDEIIDIKISHIEHVQSIINILYISNQPQKNIIKLSLDAGVNVSFIETFQKDKDVDNTLALHLDSDSSFIHQKVQNLDPTSMYQSQLNITQQKNSRYKSIFIANGAQNATETVAVEFEGENALCELNGLLKGKAAQQMSYTICVDHKVGNCTSTQNLKGIVSEKALINVDSKAIVRQNAMKSEAHQYLHNLLLDKTATVNLIPQLEIYSDDVKCSHGATVGQIDEEALFLLRARGIGYEQAKQILINAFAQEVTDKSIAGRVRI